MKRILAGILTAVLLITCLASCGGSYEENVWFTDEKLEECNVTGLPGITRSFVKHYDDDIYVSMPDAELDNYIESVYALLKSKNFEYLGTRGEDAFSFKGLFKKYYFKPVEELDDFWVNGDWIFVYSDGSTDENGDVIFCILTIYDYTKSTLTYGRNKEFNYNVKISLRRQWEAPLSGGYVLEEEHEHAVGEWVADNDKTHHFEYSCGCWYPETQNDHVNYDSDNFCDICGYDFTEGPVEVLP